jgi:hypothetical protein
MRHYKQTFVFLVLYYRNKPVMIFLIMLRSAKEEEDETEYLYVIYTVHRKQGGMKSSPKARTPCTWMEQSDGWIKSRQQP